MASWTGPATASDVRLGAYRHPDSENIRIFNQLYLDGVKGGLLAYGAWAGRHGGQQAFCPPEHLAISTEQAETLVLGTAEKRRANDDTLVALLLLAGLQDAYPCPRSGSP